MTPAKLLGDVLDAVRAGLVVATPDLKVVMWNRWMEEHAGKKRTEAVGKSLLEIFPTMDIAGLERRARQVLTLGNLGFFDPRVNGHLFPFKLTDPLGPKLDYMPQSAVIAALKGAAEDGGDLICITVTDESPAITAELKLRTLHEELLERSRRDSLTDTLNRGYVHERLENECRRTERHGLALSVILLDLDHFKALNDAYGHQAGDAALVAAARVLKSTVRETDLVGRYGGEEFVIVLPETRLDGALELAERIRTSLEELRVEWGSQLLRMTASFGVAQSMAPHEADAVLGRADEALYRAKAAGRNRSLAAQDAPMKVLVADDSALARKLLIAHLPSSPAFSTTEAVDGEQTLAAYRRVRPDIVFLDLNMPLDGFVVLNRILEIDRDARIIVVSADVQEKAAQRVLDAGAKAFIQKPVTPASMEEALRSALRKSR